MTLPNPKRKQLLILALDILILYLSLFIALVLRSWSIPSAKEWSSHVWYFSIAFAGWVAIFYTAGLYSLDIVFDGEACTRRLLAGSCIATLATAVMFYLDRDADIAPKTLLALFAIVSVSLIRLWRYFYGAFAARFLPKQGVAFIGANATVAEMIAEMTRKAQFGLRASLVLDEAGFWSAAIPRPAQGVPVASERLRLAETIDSGETSLVIIADERAIKEETRRLLYSLLDRKIRYMGLPDFYEILFRRVPLLDIDEAWFLEKIDLRSKRLYGMAKRALDFVAGAACLALSLPFWPLIGLAVAASSRGPVFFKQKRLGKDGKVFTMYKFRTMRIDGNDYAPTAEGDSRVTTIGKLLRAARIDELPQLLNILVGDMSWVGPRPERPELAETLAEKIPFYKQRLLVKPGITGWDQVSGEYHSPSVSDTYKKLQYDLYYIKNMSPFLDASIFFKTILTVIMRSGR